MFASAQARFVALAVAVAFALTTVPASAQARPQEEHGLPMTPPPLERSNPRYETAPEAQPSGSPGLVLLFVFVGPLGLALGGPIAAATPGTVFTPTPRLHPLAPADEQRSTGASE